MADAPPGGAPAAALAPGAGAPPPETGGDATDNFMAEIGKMTGDAPPADPPKPSEPTPKPAPAAAKAPEPPKPAAAPEPPKPAAAPVAKPPEEKPLDWKTAPTQFRTAFEKLKTEFDNKTAEYERNLSTTQSQMKALESREFLTPEQKARYADLEKQQTALQSELYARDYRESPDFQKKWNGKVEKVYTRLDNELKSIRVAVDGAERPATRADFEKIRALGNSQVEQRRAAKQLFGDDADVIIAAAVEVKSIEDAANDEIDAKRASFDNDRKAQGQRSQEDFQKAKTAFDGYDRQLVEKFKEYFAPIEGNPEYNKALEEGLKFVDSNSTTFNQKTPEQQAHSSAMVRRFAAAFPALLVRTKQLVAQLEEANGKIAKLQGNDPGNAGGGGPGGGGEPEAGGTDALSMEIEKLQRQG